jgi:hypothetical protein
MQAGTIRTAIRAATALFVVAFAGVQVIRPERTNASVDPGRRLEAHVRVPSDVSAVLARACADCHSDETRWPWYSQVAPVSWFVIDHVNHGRSHLNFSRWAEYSDAERRTRLENVCALVTKGEMPLASYTLVHRDARLTSGDVRLLCDWSAAGSAQILHRSSVQRPVTR